MQIKWGKLHLYANFERNLLQFCFGGQEATSFMDFVSGN